MFSPFLPLFSRGTQGELGLLARPRAAFRGGAKKRRIIVLFLGGTANPEGLRQGTDKAEGRRAASAQEVSQFSKHVPLSRTPPKAK